MQPELNSTLTRTPITVPRSDELCPTRLKIVRELITALHLVRMPHRSLNSQRVWIDQQRGWVPAMTKVQAFECMICDAFADASTLVPEEQQGT